LTSVVRGGQAFDLRAARYTPINLIEIWRLVVQIKAM